MMVVIATVLGVSQAGWNEMMDLQVFAWLILRHPQATDGRVRRSTDVVG